jgi:carbon-monoxide dehydrogenase small subunit
MTRISLIINGEPVDAEVEPRTTLADFLRNARGLTGTHLGCEHGVCGACTIMIDGAPARSCITYAVQMQDHRIDTIEGFDDDATMAALRSEFSQQHALQCGFCTPGMLITARDIVSRLGNPGEARVREELAGNLCRCTGYAGIVRAVQNVGAALGRATEASPSSTAEAPVPKIEDRRPSHLDVFRRLRLLIASWWRGRR